MADTDTNWRIAVAELRTELHNQSADISDLKESLDMLQPRLSHLALVDVRSMDSVKDIQHLETVVEEDGRKIDRLFTGLKVAGVVAGAVLTLAMALTPWIVRSAIRDAINEQATTGLLR